MMFICNVLAKLVLGYSVLIGLSDAQCAQGNCKPGWCQAPLGKTYCYQVIQMNDVESGGWSDQIMACNQSSVPYAYPLMETDNDTLDHILIPFTHAFVQTIFAVGAYNETGVGPEYLDGSKNFPYRLCQSTDFYPWDTNSVCAPNCGKCGFIMSSAASTSTKEYCMAFIRCDRPDFDIGWTQYQHVICQYQKKAESMVCPAGFQSSPLGDRCLKFVPDAHLSWLDAFCNSVVHGNELAIIRNLLDLWSMSNQLAKITDAGLGAFVGGTSLGSKQDKFQWIDGSKLQPFVLFYNSPGKNKCISVATNITQFYDKLFFTSFEYIDCGSNSTLEVVTIPAVYEYKPDPPAVPEEILCAVANIGAALTKYQYCLDLLKIHSCSKNVH